MHMRRGAGAAVLSVLLLTSLLTTMGLAASNGGDGSGNSESLKPTPGIVTPSHPLYNQDKAFDYFMTSYGIISPATAIYERVSELGTIEQDSQYKSQYYRSVLQGIQQVEAYASSNQSESLNRVLNLLENMEVPSGTASRAHSLVETAKTRDPSEAKEAALFTGKNKLKGFAGFGNSIMDFLSGFGDFLGPADKENQQSGNNQQSGD